MIREINVIHENMEANQERWRPTKKDGDHNKSHLVTNTKCEDTLLISGPGATANKLEDPGN
jgi:hypothetical protein